MTALLDTHQHLIYPKIAGYDWTDRHPALAKKTFSLETYKSLTKGADIVGSIFMEAGVAEADYQAETRFVAELSNSMDSRILGIIASCRPESDTGFEDWLDECEELGVVGYRRILHVMDDAVSADNTFRKNVRKIGERGLTFDACFQSRQLPIALEFAQACDNTILVLNHCGCPDIVGSGLEPWRSNMRALAAVPNVVCKLSGILAYCAPGKASLASIQPYIDHVLEVFGSDRIVWGSDWPVVNIANGLADWITVTQQILSKLSESEAKNIGSQNAARVYRVARTI